MTSAELPLSSSETTTCHEAELDLEKLASGERSGPTVFKFTQRHTQEARKCDP